VTLLAGFGQTPRSRAPSTLPLSPDAIEREYYLTVIKPFLDLFDERMQRILIEQLPSLVASGKIITRDALSLDVDQTLDGIFAQLERALQSIVTSFKLAKPVAEIGAQTSAHASLTVQRQIQSQVEVSLASQIGNVPGLADRIKFFTRENVGLIKSIPEQYLGEVESIVMRGIRTGANARDISADISARFDVADNRARLIADDQIGKFHGELRQARHKSLGIVSYKWRTRKDGNRVRATHRVREGKTFFYDKPPRDGHPGQAVRCRCFEEPILPF
jgi:SPP1 gp7 family putative phage head morphogenesis protein